MAVVGRLSMNKSKKKPKYNRVLLKTNMGAGHGGASGRYDKLRETAFDYAFLLDTVGVSK